MADIYRKFLEDQAAAARAKADALIEESNQAIADAEAYERSLAAYMRSGSTSNGDVQGSPTAQTDKSEAHVTSGKSPNKGKEWDVSLDTKVGVLRNIFVSTSRDLSIDEMLTRHPKEANVEIDRGDIYRMLPRFIKRGEIKRVGRGVFRYLQRSEIERIKEG